MIQRLLDNAAKDWQLLVRLRAADDNGMCRCFICGAPGRYAEMEGAHYIPRKCKFLLLDPSNCRACCTICNQHLGGNLKEYRHKLIQHIGLDMVEWLESCRHFRNNWTREGVKNRHDDIKQDIKREKERIGA